MNDQSKGKNIVISKESVNRLLKDVRNIMKNPLTDNGIYYVHDDVDMLKGYALIIGPSDTPYFGGNYFFEFHYPMDYPHSPPKLIYCTNGDRIRFNPNLYACGKVCISILNTWRGEQWTSCQTISTVLLTLCTLLCKNPLLNEPGVTNIHPDFEKYTKIIEYKNIDIAVIKMVEKKEGIYPPQFSIFYPYVRENFLKNADELIKYLEAKKNVQTTNELLSTGLYSMTNIKIDYDKLYKEFVKTLKRCKESEII
jgi:ubiquitin-conjugating enzyme E2 Z